MNFISWRADFRELLVQYAVEIPSDRMIAAYFNAGYSPHEAAGLELEEANNMKRRWGKL
jgi:hypothetical protein